MATAKVKVENYSAAVTAQVIADYAAGVSTAAIAEKVGKSVRSVVAKLAREGVYQKKEYVAKDGSKAESKADIVADIAAKLGCEVEEVGTLESATKAALKLVAAGLDTSEIICEVEPEAVDNAAD